jgi:dUTP pyrophosphatase
MAKREVPVLVHRLRDGENFPLPSYASEQAAAMDLYAATAVTIFPGQASLVPTGIAVAIPEGFEAQIRPRSGLALQSQVTVLNSPGTIDADYRGEIAVLLINHGKAPFFVEPRMRIAQLLVVPVPRVQWVEVNELPPTRRGRRGFGHTGVK